MTGWFLEKKKGPSKKIGEDLKRSFICGTIALLYLSTALPATADTRIAEQRIELESEPTLNTMSICQSTDLQTKPTQSMIWT
jgi:hypothetical protein